MTKLENCKTGMARILFPDQPGKLAIKMGIREEDFQ
jgi:hypothetical protein